MGHDPTSGLGQEVFQVSRIGSDRVGSGGICVICMICVIRLLPTATYHRNGKYRVYDVDDLDCYLPDVCVFLLRAGRRRQAGRGACVFFFLFLFSSFSCRGVHTKLLQQKALL